MITLCNVKRYISAVICVHPYILSLYLYFNGNGSNTLADTVVSLTDNGSDECGFCGAITDE